MVMAAMDSSSCRPRRRMSIETAATSGSITTPRPARALSRPQMMSGSERWASARSSSIAITVCSAATARSTTSAAITMASTAPSRSRGRRRRERKIPSSTTRVV